MEPQAGHAALAPIICEGIDGAFLWHNWRLVLSLPMVMAVAIAHGCSSRLLWRTGAVAAAAFLQVEDLDDSVGVAEDERVLGGGEGDSRDLLLGTELARGELTFLSQVILRHVARFCIEAEYALLVR